MFSLETIRSSIDQAYTWLDEFAKAHPYQVFFHLAFCTFLAFYLFSYEHPKKLQEAMASNSNPAAAQSVANSGAKGPTAPLPKPKDDPIPYDGSDPSLPVYVAIKGKVFDVSSNREAYAPGAGYNIFAGRDGSKALGKSSLKAEDAIADYSDLDSKELKVLDDWVLFFEKRYPIVGRVVN
ncbi:cytochrome b5 [Atractiella rhizophila]|nr:cytochrome b5 [Atractiella rhizophila]